MTKPAILDKSRSFATVHGGAGARYLQDYKQFDHRGIEILANGEDVEPAETAEPGDDYENWPWRKLAMELEKRTGKGPKPSTPKDQIIETLRALDAEAEAEAEAETGAAANGT